MGDLRVPMLPPGIDLVSHRGGGSRCDLHDIW